MSKLLKIGILILTILCATTFANVLVLTLNSVEYSEGEAIRISGAYMDDSLGALNASAIYVYLDDAYYGATNTLSDGTYEMYINNVSAGTHKVTASTPTKNETLTFTVYEAALTPTYKIIASSLVVRYADPVLNSTVEKYLGDDLTYDNYSYSIYYDNGTLFSNATAASGSSTLMTFPQAVGLYTVVVDNKKSFTVSVATFTLKFKITGKAGDFQDVFKPGDITYFEVEGFSNGQRITNGTVTARVIDQTGTSKTVTFTEASGVYSGNTNVTTTTPIQLAAGEYEVEFKFKDTSNNEQKIKGYFSVLGLSVKAELVDKKPYMSGETAEFDVVVKSLANGNLIDHSDILYTFELERDGKFFDVSGINVSASSDPTISSEITLPIEDDFNDGGYFLRVRASANGKSGNGNTFMEVMNTEIFVEFTDNYGGIRDLFQPGELAKLTVRSNENLSFIKVKVKDTAMIVKKTKNTTVADDVEGTVSFNVPTTQAEYVADITILTAEGVTIKRQKWFKVQNYMSFMDIKNRDGEFQFTVGQDEDFVGEINVFDISNGEPVDLTGFVVKFDKIIGEETQQEYTNLVAVKNVTLSDQAQGRISYDINPPSLPYGVYRIEYSLVDSSGKSFKGDGWFGVSAFDVYVRTYDTNGQQKEIFSAGASINVSIELSTAVDGIATIHREFFNPLSFNVTAGVGSVLLTATNQQLPSQSGFYRFGVEVISAGGDTGLGDGSFEIRNMNIRSIAVRNNAEAAPADNIVADVTVEKSGSLLEGANVTISRLIRTYDGYEIPQVTSSNTVTGATGQATLTLDPTNDLEPGNYFAEFRVVKGTDMVFDGFGFEVVEDDVQITINDDDSMFSSSDTVEITIRVTYQNGTARNNISVNLTGLLNFNTWAPTQVKKLATTSSAGVATITLSASNYNAGRYAPIIDVEGMTNNVVGFGDGEFEIRSFVATVSQDKESYSIDEDLVLEVNVTGEVTITANIVDMLDADVDRNDYDYYYSDGILSVNNELEPGEYFIDVTLTQSTKTMTKRLWFEVIAPSAHIEPLMDPNTKPSGEVNFTYTIFTQSAQGWAEANATLIIASIENLWTGEQDIINDTVNVSGDGNYAINISSYNLSKGDYFLNLEILESPEFMHDLYFRIDKNVMIMVDPEIQMNNATIVVNTSGMSNPITVFVDSYFNFKENIHTDTNYNVSGTDVVNVELTGLDNGFYVANLRIKDNAGDEYYWDVYFDIDVREVDIEGPMIAMVGDEVQFNYTSTINTTFWIINQYSGLVEYKTPIFGSGSILYTFPYASQFAYSFGVDKWEAFGNADFIDIREAGMQVEWPFESNRFVLSSPENFSFNVSSDLTDTPLTLIIKSHFDNTKHTFNIGNTSSVAQEWTEFTFDIVSDLGLDNGPHDVELVLEDGSTDPPRQFFFIDIFPDQYEMFTWSDQWEYRAGENVTIHVDIHDILNNSMPATADNVTLEFLDDSMGIDTGATVDWTPGDDFAFIQTNAHWVSGNYHGDLNITKNGISRLAPVDFFLRGNDNIEVFWNQDKWDYSSSEIVEVTFDVRDSGAPLADIEIALESFEKHPEEWNETPTDMMASVSGAYNFTPENKTGVDGRVTFRLDLSQAMLPTGGYGANLLVGGRYIWIDFQVQTYQIDAYTTEWEYGLTDTIEMNVRARDMATWNPITENGNLTIVRIEMHDPDNWMPQSVPLRALGIDDPKYEVYNGEALIEMALNSSMINLTKPMEFEVTVEMNLTGSGVSEGWALFRISNTAKPSVTLYDRTGTAADTIYAGQEYSIVVTNVNNATLRNLWGPGGREYNEVMLESERGFESNFTTPNSPGGYTLEIEVERDGWWEYTHYDFNIGGTTELHVNLKGRSIVPDINFTVNADLFGEGDDPWCTADPYCTQDWTWFGPLTNKTIVLEGIKDLDTFVYTNLSGLNISKQTSDFPSSWFPQQLPDCNPLDQFNCENTTPCKWDNGSSQCMLKSNWCSLWSVDDCTDRGCLWEGSCWYDDYMDMEEDSKEEMGIEQDPGMAFFNLDPNMFNMEGGKKYSLKFSYDDGESSIEEKLFLQVEEFHASISKNHRNIAANSRQSVWVKTAYLNGTALENCTVSFSAIYDEKDYSLVKSLSISNETDENGSLVFQYYAPTLPGEYLVEGEAECELNSTTTTQEISYFIDVGAKAMSVDMKNKFEEGKEITLLITTKDRLGNPVSQNLEVLLFHNRDDYPMPVYSEGGVDCQRLDAAEMGSFDMGSNRLEISTDENGYSELVLCPMPKGEYAINVYPMFDMMTEPTGKKDDNDIGFRSDFMVSSADIQIETDLTYAVGSNVTLNVSALDENGNEMNGSIVFADSLSGVEEEMGGAIIYEKDLNITLANGSGQISYVIPSLAPDKITGENTTVLPSMIDVAVVIQDEDGAMHSTTGMKYVIVSNLSTTVRAPTSVMTSSPVEVYVETHNDQRYKIQFGMFMLKDNTELEKDWFIENGVFLEDIGSGRSAADFQVMSPKEPGTYYLAIPVFTLDADFDRSQPEEILISEIEVNLDLVNVTGTLKDYAGDPIELAEIKIGKREITTAPMGEFSMQVPKGKYQVEVMSGQQYMKSDYISFNTDRDLNMTLYPLSMNGSLVRSTFNITQSTNIETETKLQITTGIRNYGLLNITNASVIASAPSGKTLKLRNVTDNSSISVTFSQLFAGFKDSVNELTVKLKVGPKNWNSTGFFDVSDVGSVNSTVGVKIRRTYVVETYATPGDHIDNDNDGVIDEEIDNNKDDDNDGKIDEDLESPEYIEGGYCGDGICKVEEEGNCYDDCGGVTQICGDMVCDGDEANWCPTDCNMTAGTCTPWTCDDISYAQGEWCNEWGVLTTESFCDFCSWVEPAYCGQSCDEFNCWACDPVGGSSSDCELAGCTVGTDDSGNFCYYEAECSANDCWSCMNESDCGSTGSCDWVLDSYSPEGGNCERPWDCSFECGACAGQSECEASNATMMEGNNTINCIWRDEGMDQFCDFNFSNDKGRPMKNFWISTNASSEVWDAPADYEWMSPNNGQAIDEGCYYIIVEMSEVPVYVWLNGTLVGNFTGVMEVQTYATDICYNLTNGTWFIEVQDQMMMADYFPWYVEIGGNGSSGGVCGDGFMDMGEECDDGNVADGDGCSWDCKIEMGGPMLDLQIYEPMFDEELMTSDVYVEYNLSGDFTNYSITYMEIDDGSIWNDTRVDSQGIHNLTFNNVSDGFHTLNIITLDGMMMPLNMRDLNFSVNTSGAGVCGDGFMDMGEECDDGNNADGDGCSWDCKTEMGGPMLDLQIYEPMFDEELMTSDVYVEYNLSGDFTNYSITYIEIDDGSIWNDTRVDSQGVHNLTFNNVSDGFHTLSIMALDGMMMPLNMRDLNFSVNTSGAGVCGNGFMDMGEECDDGNVADGDGCSWDCRNEMGGVMVDVFIMNPMPDEVINGNNLYVEYNLSGNLSMYNLTYVEIDDGMNWNHTAVDGFGVFNYTFIDVGPGNHTLHIEVVDDMDMFIGMDEINFTMDQAMSGSSFKVKVLEPTPGAVVSKDIFIEYNLSGNFTDYNYTLLKIDNGFTWKNMSVDGPGLFNWTFYNVSIGPHVVVVEAMVNETHSLSFEEVNVTVEEGIGGAGIMGNISGSPAYVNVSIRIFNESMETVYVGRTDKDGLFMADIPPGVYEAEFMLDQLCEVGGFPCPEQGFVLYIENITVSGTEEMNINIPHLTAMLEINDTPLMMDVIDIMNNSDYEFSMNLTNYDNFTVDFVNVTLDFRDSMGAWNLPYILNDEILELNATNTSYAFIPFRPNSPYTIRNLSLFTDLEIPTVEVVSSTFILNPTLELFFDAIFGINITGGP